MKDLRGKRVLVVGLARSGHAAALSLRRHGAVVTVTDIRPPHTFQAMLPELMAQKIGLELGSQREEIFLRNDLVVISPGVPWDLPQLRVARERGIPVIPEVEAASWFLEGIILGVTGSNGKTTTASLLGKILEASGFPTFVGGNIGVPLSSAVDQFSAGSYLVTELSSFQLEAIQDFRPHVAVFLNLSPNHLDRHPSMEAYAQAKRQIFRNQQADDYAILNLDDPAVAALAPSLAARKVFFSRRQPLPDGVFVSDGQVIYRVGHLERVLFETREVGLRGAFNLEDALAASAAAVVVGADFDALRAALREFRGVEHRLEFVQTISGVEFYNNSKATSVDASVKSLEAFERGVHLILGGKDKGAPYAPLRPLFPERVREVLLIGQAAERITKELSGAVELVQAGDLATAVREAFKRAVPGDTVLLAPACASFDQFQDFEHRGRVFKELVHELAREVEAEPAKWKKAEPPTAPVETPASLPEPIVGAHRHAPPSEAPRVPATPPREAVGAGLPTASGQVAPPSSVETPASAPEPIVGAQSHAPLPEASSGLETPPPEPIVGAPLLDAQDRAGTRPAPTPLERVYVYEVGAEELPPAELEAPPQFVDDAPPEALGSSSTPDAGEDEPLPFEARQEAAEAAGDDGAASPAPEGSSDAKVEEGSPLRARQSPEKGAPKAAQARLPGID
jgi:UDP-N-acetylmuramoylalanine--D-glutamate ligase